MKFFDKLGINIKKAGILAGILSGVFLLFSLLFTLAGDFELPAGYVVVRAFLAIFLGIATAFFFELVKSNFKNFFPDSEITAFKAFKKCIYVFIILLIIINISTYYQSIDGLTLTGEDEFTLFIFGLLYIIISYIGCYLFYVLTGFIYTKAILIEKINKNTTKEEMKEIEVKDEIKEEVETSKEEVNE